MESNVTIPKNHGYADQKYVKGNTAPVSVTGGPGISWEQQDRAYKNATVAGGYAKTMDNAAAQNDGLQDAKNQSGDFMKNVGQARIKQQQDSMRATADEQEK